MQRGHPDFLLARAQKISRALEQKNWTQRYLAQRTGCDEKTIFNLLTGKQVSDRTVIEVCQALGIEPELEHVSQLAAERFDAYARVVVRHLEGVFFAYRPSFTAPSRLMRTVFRFTWSDAQGCLVFEAQPLH